MTVQLEPPTCLKKLRIVKSTRSADSDESWEFAVACSCGADVTRVAGHWLVHPDRAPEQVFVGPLFIECQSCGVLTPLLDTSIHGYDAVLNTDYNMKGSGAPVPYDERFGQVIASFSYQIDDLEELAVENSVPPADLFDSCGVWLVPRRSDERVLVAGFECA